MKTLGDRIAGLRGLKSRDDFAEVYGIHRHTLAKWETNAVVPDGEILYKMSSDYDIPVDWLINGFAEKTSDCRNFSEPEITQHIKNIDFNKNASSDVGGFGQKQCQCGTIKVPLVEAVLSAGGGSFEVGGKILEHYAFRSDWLKKKGLGRVDGMVLMRVSGDSMLPDIKNNDLVLIDQNNKQLQPGKVFAVAISNMIYLKKVNATPDELILTSYNKDFQPMKIATEQMQDSIRIIGRAIWWCHEA